VRDLKRLKPHQVRSALRDPDQRNDVKAVLGSAVALADLKDHQRWKLLDAIRIRLSDSDHEPAAVVPRSSLFVNLSNSRGLSFTLAAALLSDIAAHDPRMGVAVGLVSAALDRVRRLKKNELEAIEAMRLLSAQMIYRVWVDEEALIKQLPGNDTEAHRRTLASMKSRGILEEGAGKWRAIL
jgi:hypothetical protein